MDFNDILNTSTSHTGKFIYELCSSTFCGAVVDSFCNSIFNILGYIKDKYYFVKQKDKDSPIYLVRNLKKSPIEEAYIRREWQFIADFGFPISGEHIMAVVSCAENTYIADPVLKETITDFANKFIHTETPIKKRRMYFLMEYRANRYVVNSFNLQKEEKAEIPGLREMADSNISYKGDDIREALATLLDDTFERGTHIDDRLFDYDYFMDPYHISAEVFYFVKRVGSVSHLERDILKPISYHLVYEEFKRLCCSGVSARGIEIKDTFISYRNYLLSGKEDYPENIKGFIKDYIETDKPLKDKVFYKINGDYFYTAKRDLILSPRKVATA